MTKIIIKVSYNSHSPGWETTSDENYYLIIVGNKLSFHHAFPAYRVVELENGLKSNGINVLHKEIFDRRKATEFAVHGEETILYEIDAESMLFLTLMENETFAVLNIK